MKNFAKRNHLRRFLAALLTTALPLVAMGQAYPDKPVKVVVPYAPGGSVDIVTRVLAQKLSASMGQQFIVENRPGANGNIGIEAVIKSPADGYSLVVVGDSSATVNPHLYKGMTINPARDLVPISMLTKISIGLVVNAAVPANTVPEFLDYVKGHPGGLSYASPGAGTTQHLAGELFKRATGAQLVHIPYKGGGAALADILGNQVPSSFIALAVVAPHIKSGKIKLLAVTQSTRSPSYLNTPTIGETVKGYDFTSWMGLFAPVGTPAAVVQKLNAEIKKALTESATAQALAAQSLEVVASPPAELTERLNSDFARWGELIKATGITVQ